jgi:hypothetical protein
VSGGLFIPGGGPVGGGSVDPVTPPAPTSEAVASAGSPAAKTFGAFTDTGGRIASYAETLTKVVGTGTVSGTGLGAYTFSGTADGDVYLLELDAKDSGGDILATATHTVSIAAAGAAPFWTLKKSLDLKSMTPTSLVAGSQTVDGETIYCSGTNNVIDSSGLTVGSGGGTVAYVTMGSYLTDYDRPLFVQIKSAVSWVGTGLTSTVRWRVFRDTAGTGPSVQWVADVNVTNLDIQMGFQDGGTGNAGTFGVSAGETYTGTPAAVVLNFLLVGNQAYAWMTETLSAAGNISTMMAPEPDKVRVSYSKESSWNSGIWQALIVGIYRDTNSIPTIEQIDVYEGS